MQDSVISFFVGTVTRFVKNKKILCIFRLPQNRSTWVLPQTGHLLWVSRQVSTCWRAGSCAQPAAPGWLEFRAACASAGGTGTVQKPGHPRGGKKQGDRSAFTSECTHQACPPPVPHARAAARPGAPTHTHSEGPERPYSCWARPERAALGSHGRLMQEG